MVVRVLTIVLCIILAAPLLSASEEADKPTKKDERELQREIIALQKEIIELKKQHAEQLERLSTRLENLSQRVAAIDSARPAEQSASVPAGTVSAPPQDVHSGEVAVGGEAFNPKISVIADITGAYQDQGGETADDFGVREVEIGFSGHVDTWGRFDMTTTFHNHLELGGHEHGGGLLDDHDHEDLTMLRILSDDDLHEEGEEAGHGGEYEIEEAYFTFLTLPADLQARVGQFRNRVGKTNEFHPHSIPWTEYPLVIQRYFGEEGLIGTGASVSWLSPLQQYTEVTYEAFKTRAEEESGLAMLESEDYSHLLNATTFFELGGNTNLELGYTTMTTPSLLEDSNWLNGVDATLRWDPAGDGTFRRFEWRTEAFGLRKTLSLDHDEHEDEDHEEVLLALYSRPGTTDEGDEEHGEDEAFSRENMLGLYSSISYRMNRWFELTGRYDYVEGPFDPDLTETSWSAYLTWWQSEYAFWRLGWVRSEQELEGSSFDPLNRIWLQFNLSLGPHPAHKY